MPYRLKRNDTSMQYALRRIAGEQIEAAVRAIDDTALPPDATVHELRKRCKKVRGLLRLVRPEFEDYQTENTAFRDIAANVSGVRDADVLIATCDAVVTHYQDQVERPALAAIRRGLTISRNQQASDRDPAALLSQCRQRLLQAADRVDAWQLQADGFAAVQGGLGKTYRRARKAMRSAQAAPSPENFHRWRKRCKYHWYHARLLRPIWPGPMQAHARCAHALGDLLGEHHDLAVFAHTLNQRPEDFGKPAGIEVMTGLVRSRQAVLARQAFAQGARLLAESPSALTSSWGARFDVWRSEHAG